MDEFLSFIGAELIHSPVLDDVDWDLQMDEFLSFIGAELIQSPVLDDVDWDLQMDECLPFTGRELVQSPVLGQADGSGPADGRVSPLHWGRTRTFSCPWANCSVFELKCACKISTPKVLHSWKIRSSWTCTRCPSCPPQPPMLFEHSTLPNTTCPHAHMPYLTTCRDCSDGIYAVRAPLLIIKLLLLMLSASSCSCLIMCGQALVSSPELLMMATPCTCPP